MTDSALSGEQVPGSSFSQTRREQRRRVVRRSAAIRSRSGSESLQLTTIVLDLGGVVVPTLFEIMNDTGFPAGPFGDDPDYNSVEHGRTQERDYWAEVGRRRPDLDIEKIMQTRLYVRSEIKTMFADLGGSVRITGLTNDMGHWFGPNWGQHFPEIAAFDLLLEAAGSGMLKPDPSVFRWALGQLGEPPSNCLFVDDLPVNLRGARAAGMQTEHFDATDPAGSVERILSRFGRAHAERPPRVFGRTGP